MTWCSIQSSPGFSLTTSRRYTVCLQCSSFRGLFKKMCTTLIMLFIFLFLSDPQSVKSCHFPWPVQANGSSDREEETDVHPEIWRSRKHWSGRYSLKVFTLLFHIHIIFFFFYYSFTTLYSLGDLSARCHYCTHYSSAIIVASFLVRMEPFSHTFQTLQVGPSELDVIGWCDNKTSKTSDGYSGLS